MLGSPAWKVSSRYFLDKKPQIFLRGPPENTVRWSYETLQCLLVRSGFRDRTSSLTLLGSAISKFYWMSSLRNRYFCVCWSWSFLESPSTGLFELSVCELKLNVCSPSIESLNQNSGDWSCYFVPPSSRGLGRYPKRGIHAGGGLGLRVLGLNHGFAT